MLFRIVALLSMAKRVALRADLLAYSWTTICQLQVPAVVCENCLAVLPFRQIAPILTANASTRHALCLPTQRMVGVSEDQPEC